MDFEIGRFYSRIEIQRQLGGESETYLPQRDGKIVYGCFDRTLNPDVPWKILVGDAPRVWEKALLFEEQKGPIPCFLKLSSNRWKYLGLYLCEALIDDDEDPEFVIAEANRANRENVIAVLKLKSAKTG